MSRSVSSRWLMVVLLSLGLTNAGCQKADNPAIYVPTRNDVEPITRVELTLTPVGGGTPISTQIADPDGRGPLPAVEQTAPIVLLRNRVYNGRVRVYNDLTSPTTNVTTEIADEQTAHRVFYTVSNASGVAVSKFDHDDNGLNVGLAYQVTVSTAAVAATGKLNVVLSHYDAVAKTTADRPSPQTDASVTFDFSIFRFVE